MKKPVYGLILLVLTHFAKRVYTKKLGTYQPCKAGFLQMGRECYKFTGLPQVPYLRAIVICDRLDAQLADVVSQRNRTDVISLLHSNGYHQQSYWISVNNGVVRRGSNDGLPRVEANSCTVISEHPSYAIRHVACNSRHLFVCQRPIEERSRPSQRLVENGFSCFGRLGYFANPRDCNRYFLCFNGSRRGYRCPKGSTFVASKSRCVRNAVCSDTVPEVGGAVTHNDDNDAGINEKEELIPEEEQSNLLCEPGYRRYHSKCYKIFEIVKHWKAANRSCDDGGSGRLATIRNRGLMNFLRKQLRNKIGDFWIGLNDIEQVDKYVWSDGQVLASDHYNNWSTSSRARRKDSKRCVKLSSLRSRKWMDATCTEENNFICQKNAVKTMKEPSPNCGRFHTAGMPRVEAIVGGTHAYGKTHPWQASLRFQGDHKCGGSLIDRCWIMTAAHCVSLPEVRPDQKPTEAVLGDYNLVAEEDYEERLAIGKIFPHPNYSALPVPTNDIALIKLRRCSKKHNPICLPTSSNFTLAAGTECNIAGYGTVNPDREVYPERLMEATVPVIEWSTCRSLYSRNRNRRRSYVTSAMFCAGYLTGRIDACQGDSGGPLTCRGEETGRETQWGIISWGNGCAEANKPGVYTKVTYFHQWIRNVTFINF